MTREELIKEAFAYGASIAYQEMGIEKRSAEEAAEGLTEEALQNPEMKHRVLTALFGPIGAGLGAPKGKGWGSFGNTWLGGTLGTLGGGALGGGAGAGIGALASKLTKTPLSEGALSGGTLGAILGSHGGSQYGMQKGLTRAYRNKKDQ